MSNSSSTFFQSGLGGSSGSSSNFAIYQFDTNNGKGSSSTTVQKWSNNGISNDASSILTVINSATLGNTYTVNKACDITIVYCCVTDSSYEFAISKNSSQLTTEPYNLTITTRLGLSTCQGNTDPGSLTIVDRAIPGDVYRPVVVSTSGASASPDRGSIYVFAKEL